MTIKGIAHEQNKAPSVVIRHSFALTEGVDDEWWERWWKANQETDMVKRGFIFAHEKSPIVEGMAKENSAAKTGFERLDPETDLPAGVKTADEQPKR